MDKKSRLQIGFWLLAGALIIFVQMILGGITRLTGSGLSITHWDIVMGALPPLNRHDWQVAFNQYKLTPQYTLVNKGFTLSDFKHIFFWEFIHRLWARVMLGGVFFLGLIYFFFTKRLTPSLVKKSIIAVLLGGLEGLMGWIMVQSGLRDVPFVAPLDLTAHLLLALLIFSYLLWISLPYLIPENNFQIDNKKIKGSILTLLTLLAIQIAFGGLMAGNHAAMSYPSWPTFNGNWLPTGINDGTTLITNLTHNVATIQLIHRTLAYLIAIYIFYLFIRYRKSLSALQGVVLSLLPVMVLLQITLGVLTLLYTNTTIPVVLGVIHQSVGWLTFANVLVFYFLIKRKHHIATQGL